MGIMAQKDSAGNEAIKEQGFSMLMKLILTQISAIN